MLQTIQRSGAVDNNTQLELLNSATTALVKEGSISPDAIQAFRASELPGPTAGALQPAGGFADPLSFFNQNLVNTEIGAFLADRDFDFATPLRQFSPDISQFAEGVASLAGETQSGEEVVSQAISDIGGTIDDLMKEASTLDLSTQEGRDRLADIQLEFAQLSRLLEALSQMLAKFDELQQSIIRNIG